MPDAGPNRDVAICIFLCGFLCHSGVHIEKFKRKTIT